MLNLSTLNPQQRLAVETINGPVLILAGAGTGKTRVITFRIGHLVERGIAPGSILAVTFTNKAAREMQERVYKLIPRRKPARGEPDEGRENRPTICTFHSLCVRILRQHIEKLGYKRNFVIYDESEQLGAIRKILSHMSGAQADAGEVLGMLSRYRNLGERSRVFGDPNLQALADHVRIRYESALRACNAVDFDDLILLTLRLFKEHPEALEACRAKYRYVMVDEYQDTNVAQFELVHALTREHQNLCVVGDDDQSIYGWRGAEISNLLDMERHYPGLKLVKLEQNYRSTNVILNAANALIKHNARRRGKQLWSQNGGGERISLHVFKDDEEEARSVVDLIEFNRMARRIQWREQAILFRTNAQSRPIETALRQRKVRYHLIGGQSFFDRREIRDLLAYLKAMMNPNDDVSLLRIANVPARGLSDVTMERLVQASQERHCSVYKVMTNPSVVAAFQRPAREAIEAFTGWLERTRDSLRTEQGSLPLSVWADRFLAETGYFAELVRLEKNKESAEARVRSLRELIGTMAGRPDQARKSGYEALETFLEEVTLDSDREEEEEEKGDVVTLITVHSCKGLEFPHVFIVGVEDGLMPHARSREENTLDEERRLFYVAITRAMKTLTMSYCRSRTKYGKPHSCIPSAFLRELPEDLVERSDEKAKTPVTTDAGRNFFDMMKSSIE
jgi:superfamily I DNA/RNA helicase